MGFRGFFFVQSKGLRFEVSVDIFHVSTLKILVERDERGIALRMETEKIDHEKLLRLIDKELSESFPFLKGIKLNGKSHIHLESLITKEREWSLKGNWDASFPSIALPAFERLSLSDVSIDLPIALASSSLFLNEVKEQTGSIVIGDFSWRDESFGGFHLSPVIAVNSFALKEPILINIWGGRISVGDMEGTSLISPNVSLQASIGIQDLHLDNLLKDTVFPLSGSLDGEIPKVVFRKGRITFDGSLEVRTLGGLIRAEGLFIENPFSKRRNLGGNIFWEGIQLDRLTNKIPIGKISGVINGSLTGFVMEYGQPSQFVLEVKSEKKKGIKQKISVEAIKNLSLIGTGSAGVGTILNSGLNRFFSYYPYSKIGFRCRLENDVFSIRGLIYQRGKEYIIKKAIFRGIDMINQNPDNTISFKDMEERINRVFEKRGGAVKVK